MSAVPAAPRVAWAEALATRWWRVLPSRLVTFCVIELYRIRHDQSELFTRAIQPALWLLIFGETFTRLRVIPTGNLPYLDYMAPGIIAQSGLFIAIFYGIMLIWERDAGILSKLLATPTPRVALELALGEDLRRPIVVRIRPVGDRPDEPASVVVEGYQQLADHRPVEEGDDPVLPLHAGVDHVDPSIEDTA